VSDDKTVTGFESNVTAEGSNPSASMQPIWLHPSEYAFFRRHGWELDPRLYRVIGKIPTE
jgi:hypothetical protein